MSEQRKPDAPATSSLGSTRQLLDELDALMQRMLSLPVGDTPAEARPDPAPAVSLLEAPPEKPAPAFLPERPMAKQLDAPPQPPSYLYRPPEPVEQAAPKLEPESAEEPAEPTPEIDAEGDDDTDEAPEEASPLPFSPGRINTVSAQALAAITSIGSGLANEPVIQRSRLLAAGAARRHSWWLLPLRLVNGGFNLFTYLLGPLGAWLRQPSGRLFLGWLGIALLLAAIGLQTALTFLW